MKKIGLVLASLVLFSLLPGTIGCSPTPNTLTTPTETAKPTAPVISTTPVKPPEPTKSLEPQYGGILKMMTIRNPVTIGYPPTLVGNDALVIKGTLEPLLEIGPNGTYTPALATGWEYTPDGKALIFHLRQGVMFHDGSRFNAEAVKWNLDNALKSGKILNTVSSIDVVDEYTVRLNFKTFSNLVLFDLARAEAGLMVSPTAVKANGIQWAELNPIGTGPFKFKSYEREVSVKFERFNYYWEKGLPYLDGVEWYYVKESATREAMLKAGEVQGHQDLDYLTAATLKGFNIYSIPISQHGFFWNMKDPDNPFANKKVREAIEYAIDKETITREVTMGQFYPVYQCVPKGVLGYNSAIESQERKYNPEKAKQLLKEAGFPNGIEFKLYVMVNWEMDVIAAMQASLAKSGIKMDIQVLDRPAMVKLLEKGGLKKNEAAAYYFSWGADTLYGLNSYFPQRWTPEMVRPAGFLDLLLKAEATQDTKEKIKMLEQAMKMLHDDVTIVPWWGVPRVFAMNKSVQGLKIFEGNESNYINYNKAWISK